MNYRKMLELLWCFDSNHFDPPLHPCYTCVLCQCVLFHPASTVCKHMFCRECIDNWLIFKNKCPICDKFIQGEPLATASPAITYLILVSTVRCKNSRKGCTSKFTLVDLEQHMKICPYEAVMCGNSCGDVFMRKDVQKHEIHSCPVRDTRCSYCGKTGEAVEVEKCFQAHLLEHVKPPDIESDKELVVSTKELERSTSTSTVTSGYESMVSSTDSIDLLNAAYTLDGSQKNKSSTLPRKLPFDLLLQENLETDWTTQNVDECDTNNLLEVASSEKPTLTSPIAVD